MQACFYNVGTTLSVLQHNASLLLPILNKYNQHNIFFLCKDEQSQSVWLNALLSLKLQFIPAKIYTGHIDTDNANYVYLVNNKIHNVMLMSDVVLNIDSIDIYDIKSKIILELVTTDRKAISRERWLAYKKQSFSLNYLNC